MTPVMLPRKLLPKFPVRSTQSFQNLVTQHFKHENKNFPNSKNMNSEVSESNNIFDEPSNLHLPKHLNHEMNASEQILAQKNTQQDLTNFGDDFNTSKKFLQNTEFSDNSSNEVSLSQELQRLQMHNIKKPKFPVPKVIFNQFFDSTEEEQQILTPECLSPPVLNNPTSIITPTPKNISVTPVEEIMAFRTYKTLKRNKKNKQVQNPQTVSTVEVPTLSLFTAHCLLSSDEVDLSDDDPITPELQSCEHIYV